MKTYNKLVRDKIPEIIEKDNKKCEIKILNDEEYKKALSLKLVEEANEFLESNNIDELADVLEVIDAIKKAFNFNKKTNFNQKLNRLNKISILFLFCFI